MLEVLLDVHDVSKILNVQVSTVYKYSMCGRLPTVKVGGALRFRPEKIKQYIERQSKDSPTN